MKKQKCEYCQKEHEISKCPYVKSIEYYPKGGIKKVEFFTPQEHGLRAGA